MVCVGSSSGKEDARGVGFPLSSQFDAPLLRSRFALPIASVLTCLDQVQFYLLPLGEVF